MAIETWVGSRVLAGLCVGLCVVVSCSNDESGDDDGPAPPTRPEDTGAACEVEDDCYPDLDPATIAGEIECLDRVRDGYCTHTCESDDECCSVEGECGDRITQVCSPFENSEVTRCFVSCEEADLFASPDAPDAELDEEEFCQREASPDFVCRSSGGGRDNRKICVPGNCGVGASCVDDADCSGLSCVGTFTGGYCGLADCGADDCPEGSACTRLGDAGTFCLRTCTLESDCSFCRRDGTRPTCTDEVELVGATGVSVCLPD